MPWVALDLVIKFWAFCVLADGGGDLGFFFHEGDRGELLLDGQQFEVNGIALKSLVRLHGDLHIQCFVVFIRELHSIYGVGLSI